MQMGYAIETQGLEKRYSMADGQEVHAVRGIDLRVAQGEIYALLGPNGAGKTTTLSILTTLLLPSQGWARVAGFDVVTHPAQVRRRIGVTFQEVVLDQELTSRQILDFHGRLYGLATAERHRRIAELAALVELSHVLDRRSGTFSGGMKRRLELARGLMTAPEVLFLDEPTQGLDPQNRAHIWDYVRRLRAEQGLTLVLTTHYIEEAEALADRVGIIDQGRLAAEGTPDELIGQMGADMIHILAVGDPAAFLAQVQALPFVTRADHHAQGDELWQLQLGVDQGSRRLATLVAQALESGLQIREVSVARPSLGDVFLAYTGRQLREE